MGVGAQGASLSLPPRRLELGRLSVQRGARANALAALVQLNDFNPDLARCLAQELNFDFDTPSETDAENCASL